MRPNMRSWPNPATCSCGALPAVITSACQRNASQSTLIVKAIVSKEGTSRVCGIEFAEEDECSVDDHLVAECGDDVFGVEVTAIECGDKRMKRATAKDITTLWTRGIEQVVVKISIHNGRKTIPVYMECDGEQPFVVNDMYVVSGKRFRISHLKLEGRAADAQGGLEDRCPPGQAHLRGPHVAPLTDIF